jgi:hypothetical protein
VLAQTSRTAVYGPVRTVVWEGSAGDRRPYPDQHHDAADNRRVWICFDEKGGFAPLAADRENR